MSARAWNRGPFVRQSRRIALAAKRPQLLSSTAALRQPTCAAERGSDDDEERGSSRHPWSRSFVVTAHPMRSANDVGRHGGRLVCPINVREVKNLEMNHDSPP